MSKHPKRLPYLVLAVLLVAAALPMAAAQAVPAPPPGRGASSAGQNTFEWSNDLDCASCHARQAETLVLANDEEGAPQVSAGASSQEETKDAEPDVVDEGKEQQPDSADNQAEPEADGHTGLEGYAALHAQQFKMTCVSCHDDTEKLVEAHARASAGQEVTRLKKTEVSSELCIACHKLEALAEATAESTVLTDDNGLVVNPHDVPESGEHAIGCADCHKAHGDKGLERTAMTTCTSCHHGGVFECGTCH